MGVKNALCVIEGKTHILLTLKLAGRALDELDQVEAIAVLVHCLKRRCSLDFCLHSGKTLPPRN